MKKVFVALFVAVLIGSMCFLPYALAENPAQAPVQKPPMAMREKGEPNERHPQIHIAIRKLREAKQHLEKAAHDFGGHKAKAIQAIDQALRELEEALKFDRK